MAPVYQINKGVNRPIEFKGIKAQYILFLAAGMVFLLLVFAIAYLAGCNAYLLLIITLPAGAAWYAMLMRWSKKYGAHGLAKKISKQQLPRCVKSKGSKMFFLSGK